MVSVHLVTTKSAVDTDRHREPITRDRERVCVCVRTSSGNNNDATPEIKA